MRLFHYGSVVAKGCGNNYWSISTITFYYTFFRHEVDAKHNENSSHTEQLSQFCEYIFLSALLVINSTTLFQLNLKFCDISCNIILESL